jgi:endonuclease-3 related protein
MPNSPGLKIYQKLLKSFGPQGWWPAETPFEVIVGAILTQQTSWRNVEKAIENLKRERLLSIRALAKASPAKIKKLIRPALYYNQKTKKLKIMVRYLIKNYQGSLKKMFKRPLPELREELLKIHGIGRETADSILLYAGHKPIFMVDAYTKRFGERYGFLKSDNYEEVRDYFEKNLLRGVKIYQEFHALIVELGKRFCRTKPICGECPLAKGCKKRLI